MTTTPREGKTMRTAHVTQSPLRTTRRPTETRPVPGMPAQEAAPPGVSASVPGDSAHEVSAPGVSTPVTSESATHGPSAQGPPAPDLVPAEGFRQAIAKLPTGVTVLTTVTGDSPVGCTANAVMSLSADTPSVLVSLGSHSRTLAAILDTGSFAVNTLSWSQRALTRKFASGSPAERFDGVPWQPERRIPVLSAAGVALVCEVGDTAALLDHTVVVGKVVWLRHTNEAPTVLYGREQYPLGA
ncbi:flavin reductase family protein [Amycolatopsis sp. NBC_01307]|uniref:flavin reductase family protein n=1 Tax=Amycolatopsis sp. NBC_01307 TaxID=2903561 RepID=UPI002E163292|nr:flavin reductase family protein [Amycolatopsis sp. NBC_01307]